MRREDSRLGIGRVDSPDLTRAGRQLFRMDTNLDDRVTRLEESQAFLERTVEQLHEELLTAARRVDALVSRLAKAESALDDARRAALQLPLHGAGATGADTELPPHSHMPVDRHAGRTTDPFAPARDAEPPEPPRGR